MSATARRAIPRNPVFDMPRPNHCLVVYSYTIEPNGDLIFAVYDANQRDKLVHLRYQALDESFQFDKTWYYPGGLVTAMKLYVSPIM
jgi:hypothetical protein